MMVANLQDRDMKAMKCSYPMENASLKKKDLKAKGKKLFLVPDRAHQKQHLEWSLLCSQRLESRFVGFQ